ncbi:MAG: hypothetical protein U9P73_05090 [Candidatus Cloacimonadota bacterium]|nr:hypothetical protein [Candidatus Cloacimonadota bacterium]
MKLLKRIFNRKLSWEQHSFTNIVATGERVVIFCPDDSNQTSSILSHILSWKHHFKQISIILPDYDYAFFKRIDQDESTTYFNINNDIKPFNNAVIFNFSSLRKIRKVLNHCKSSTILDINNPANLQFLPTPTDPVYLLKKFADFFDFSWESYQFDIEILKSELMVAKHQFIKNRFRNFILDFSNDVSVKMIERIVHIIKQEFSANVYFTGKRIHDKEFINIEEIHIANLLELYSLIKVGDLLITDRLEIAGTLADLGVDQIFLGTSSSDRSLKCVDQNNIIEMKNVIQDILNK